MSNFNKTDDLGAVSPVCLYSVSFRIETVVSVLL